MAPVAFAVDVTLAPGSTAPLWSVTMPTSLESVCCAVTLPVQNRAIKTSTVALLFNVIFPFDVSESCRRAASVARLRTCPRIEL
jgi:hypothetical protein